MNLQTWLDKAIPNTRNKIEAWLRELLSYHIQNGDWKIIAELAESDYRKGIGPCSQDPVYLSFYNAIQEFHTIEIESGVKVEFKVEDSE